MRKLGKGEEQKLKELERNWKGADVECVVVDIVGRCC